MLGDEDMRTFQILSVVLMISACGVAEANANTYTMYRNSTFDRTMRIHWATFDADDNETYNMNNCLMAARLLNANVTASAALEGKPRHVGVGFWCEPGSFRENGVVPTTFPEAFPTDV